MALAQFYAGKKDYTNCKKELEAAAATPNIPDSMKKEAEAGLTWVNKQLNPPTPTPTATPVKP